MSSGLPVHGRTRQGSISRGVQRLGGGRCAFDLAALHVVCFIALGTSHSATAVIESAWPEVHHFGDVEGSASRIADAYACTLAVRPTSGSSSVQQTDAHLALQERQMIGETIASNVATRACTVCTSS
jgi:hypothetical protein